MSKTTKPFVHVVDVPTRAKQSNYPVSFHPRIAGRSKRPLGDSFGLASFGVNHTTLAPGAASALRHVHALQDEFIYVLEGRPTLVVDEGEFILEPGMCAGFRAAGTAHHLVNRTSEPVVYLEVGDRRPGDSARYPDDDLVGVADGRGGWTFVHKDGTAYE